MVRLAAALMALGAAASAQPAPGEWSDALPVPPGRSLSGAVAAAGSDMLYAELDDGNFGSFHIPTRTWRVDLARAYTQFSDAYVAAEATARAAGLGLWQGAATSPWDYRAEHRRPAGTEGFVPAAGEGVCTIKGNLSREGERIYHLPGAPGYASTRIDPERGEAWFCNESAARSAGFRPPRTR